VALARKALAGGCGLEADLAAVPGSAGEDTAVLYSESNSRFLVTVAPAGAGTSSRRWRVRPAPASAW